MIAASDITLRFGQKILFEHVSVKFRPGNRYGLIGANGAGKSTFMKILTGQLEPSSGSVAVDTGCTLGYLRQDHYEYDKQIILDIVYQGNTRLWKLHLEREDLYSKEDPTDEESLRMGEVEEQFGEHGGYTMESDAAKLLIGLGIPESKHTQSLSTLTGGFKLRVLLAQVLFGMPDILLLDEPTNHLDMASRDWLEDFLNAYKGTVVVISHDSYFLNKVCTHIADLDYQAIRMFTGNYDDFMTANAMLLEKVQRENAQKQKRKDELNNFINRFSANASKARQATARKKELSKIEMEGMKPSSRVSPYIRFEAAERLGDQVIEAEGIAKAYEYPLFSDFSCTIGKHEKVAIIGTNASGKTSLLKILLGRLKPDAGRVTRGATVQVGYFPQDAQDVFEPDLDVLTWLRRQAAAEHRDEVELRSALGKVLLRGDDAFKPLEVLSGGERARLILASMVLGGGNVLALDEPTNHLDLESIEALNYALSLVKETVLFVSHDRDFVNSLATRILSIEDGYIVDYPGTLEQFEQWKLAEKRRQKKSAQPA